MPDKKQLRINDIASESYEKLVRKLSSICKNNYGDNIKIRIIVAIPALDAARDSAILMITRQFGVIPVEVYNHKDGIHLQQLLETPEYSGLTLIIQSYPVNTRDLIKEKSSLVLRSRKSNSLEVHVPDPVGVLSDISQSSVDMLMQQIRVLNQHIIQNKRCIPGPVVYLSGFTYNLELINSSAFPQVRFIPWYLFIGSRENIKRIYRQPELGELFSSVTGDSPKIEDIEKYISAMDDA